MVCENGQDDAFVAVTPPDSDTCVYQAKMDYRGRGIDLDPTDSTSAEECCDLCQKTPHCSSFTFSASAGMCYLKTGHGTEVPNSLLVSGSLVTSIH